MTDSENSNSSPKPRGGGEMLWLVLAIVIAAGLFTAASFLPIQGTLMPMAGNSASSQKLADMERRVHTLEDRTNALEGRLENMPEASPKEQSRVLSSTDLAHMQNDLAQMATTVGTLQDQMKQSGTANQALAHAALAKMVAFVQLRDATVSDRSFVHELDIMRASAKDDAGLKEPLDKLAPYAEKGAPDIALLRDQLNAQNAATEVATAKAAAQSWWERILAEFRGLVLIRPVNDTGSENSGLAAVKAALANDDIAATLDAMKNLPPEAQQVLADWRKQAEARLAINEALHAIADHLATDSDMAPAAATPAPVKDTP